MGASSRRGLFFDSAVGRSRVDCGASMCSLGGSAGFQCSVMEKGSADVMLLPLMSGAP